MATTTDKLTEFKKDDSGKTDLSMLPFEELLYVAKVLEYGAVKYEKNNWKKPVPWCRLMSACLRHLTAWLGKKDQDPDTAHLEGVTHIHHAICSLLFISYQQRNNVGTDDR